MGKKSSTQKSATKVEAIAGSDQLRKEFDVLLTQFAHLDDPVARFMKRQEIRELQTRLEAEGIHVDIP